MFKAQGVYWRVYSGGLSIVNPTTVGSTVTIPGDTTYVDIYNKEYAPGTSLFMDKGTGLVLGVKGKTSTTSVVYDDRFTTIIVDATTGKSSASNSGAVSSTGGVSTGGMGTGRPITTGLATGNDHAEIDPSGSAAEGGDPVTNSVAAVALPNGVLFAVCVCLIFTIFL